MLFMHFWFYVQGYAVFRFKAFNPGLWAVHCHIALHAEGGMFMVFNESFAQAPPPPPGFPLCSSYNMPYGPGKKWKKLIW